VEALAGSGQSLWVATQGGLEEYDLAKRARVAHYTTLAGLPTLSIETVTLNASGLPVVNTAKHRCTLHAATRRFACVDSEELPAEPPSESNERIEGAPVTAHYRSVDGREWLGTAGLGVWERSAGQLRRLSPVEQIVSNHVVAIAEWKQAVYVASFDRGLGRFKEGRFSAMPLQAHLLNDVIATPTALFVAASDGLYKTEDGERFEREARVTEHFISDLAYDAERNTVYATATSSLWELALGTPTKPARSTYLPGGSRSLQAVDISPQGTVFLATEDRGVLRREGKRRFTSFDRLAGYPSSWATDVLALDGTSALFGSLHHGVFAVGGASPLPVASPSPWILFLGRDPEQPERVFVGTQGGASLIQGEQGRKLQGLPNPCVHAMARLSSGLWVGTEGGLAQYRQ
jgi:ligand-binding sensor domain-containing protein